MSLLYCAITNEKSIVCWHSLANRDFSSVVQSYLSRFPAEGHHHYADSGVTVHAFNVMGISFVAITTIETPRQQAFQFLTKLAEDFSQHTSLVNQAKQGPADSIQHSYSGTLKNLMVHFDQYKTNLQMTALQSNVEGVTNQLRQNVTELMRRGDLASNLAEKTADMESDARMFETYSKKVEQKERCANLRMKFIIIGVVAAVLLVILLIILWQAGVFRSK